MKTKKTQTAQPTDEQIVQAVAEIAKQHEGRDIEDFKRRTTYYTGLQHENGRIHLCLFQDAWADVNWYWEPNPEIVPRTRCTMDEHFPCLGGRAVRTSYSIGD